MYPQDKILNLISNRFLELIILPTEQCNFRCTYCYEDFLIGKMKPNIVTAIKKLLAQRVASLDVLKITWFGGEPLAAKDIIYDLSSYILELRSKHPSLSYISGMTTNAFSLKEEVLERLVSLGVSSYQISLDGTQRMHDQTRKRMNGSGSFQKIWDNLLAAKRSSLNFSIVIRVHLTPDNISDIGNLTDLIKLNFGNDKRFSVFFKVVENLGGPKMGTFPVLKGKAKTEILQDFYARLGKEVGLKKIDDNGPYVCYAAQTNSFMIRADGKLGKCTVAFDDERNNLGRLHNDGTIEIAADKLALWSRGLKSRNETDLSCPLAKMPPLNKTLSRIPIVVEN